MRDYEIKATDNYVSVAYYPNPKRRLQNFIIERQFTPPVTKEMAVNKCVQEMNRYINTYGEPELTLLALDVDEISDFVDVVNSSNIGQVLNFLKHRLKLNVSYKDIDSMKKNGFTNHEIIKSFTND